MRPSLTVRRGWRHKTKFVASGKTEDRSCVAKTWQVSLVLLITRVPVHCEVVDRGTANLWEGVLYFKYTWEILPVSNSWQLHALPPPSAMKMTSSCTLDAS